MALHQFEQSGLAETDDDGFNSRDNGGRARLSGEQSHFADAFAGIDMGDGDFAAVLAADKNAEAAGEQMIVVRFGITLPDQRRAGRKKSDFGRRADVGQVFIREVAEERRLAKTADGVDPTVHEYALTQKDNAEFRD